MVQPRHDWYLRQWLKLRGKKQADIVKDLDWNKARISLMVSGKQPYTREAVNELAHYLDCAPYELLLHPQDAMAIRGFRTDAIRIAHSREIPSDSDGPEESAEKVSLG